MYKTLPPKDVLEPTRNVKLVAYNGQEIPCLGSINLQLRFGEKNFTKAKFYVVDVPSAPIVGLPTCEKIGLVTIHCDDLRPTPDVTTVEGLKQAYPGQFDTLGDFRGVAKLHLKQDCEPFIDPPRKCSIHLKEKLKCELKKMEKQGVIRKVSEHTDWCSSLAYSVKKDGSLRICIDPQKLNQALKRCPHKVPTLEELNPQFAGSTVFSKLDAKAGYWSVHLDPDSQLITTFRTPFGRYCWTRLPFGLRVSQDIFQARMDEILEDLPGVVGITDDVCVHGKDEEEHDRNLKALMDRAKETGLVFNSDKCTIRQPEISFFGNIYSKDGIRPDPAKVHDIQNMSVPQDKEDLQRFLGMMTYLATFIPNFSEESQPLWDLLKKNVLFEMSEDHLHYFQKLKTAISAKSCVKYFDPTKPTTLEVDSSTKGLGAAILQDGQPVAFASKALNSAQSNYPNIDREMLAVVFGINRFHTYLYGRPFRVISDHKPLEMISKKPLLRAPPRLQRMLQKIQGYDFTIEYRQGKTMTLADTLSRLPNPKDNGAVELDLRVDGIEMTTAEVHRCDIDLVNFSQRKQHQLRDQTARDPTMNALMETIIQGWPDSIKDLPTDVRVFWSFRDELAVEDGIIFKGKQVLIPESLRADILAQLHQSHQGIEKTQLLAREGVYWPNINKDIEHMTRTCTLCQELANCNKKEPLIPHDTPMAPWKKLGTDLFEVDGEHFVLICDYFSKYPIVTPLHATTSENVTEEIRKAVSLFGRPDEIVSDNGPQYIGKPFQDFVHKWGIQHTTSSPRFPQSNGFIERQVQTIKKIIKKCKKEKQSLHLAMLDLRATPVDSKLPSPAEMLMGRPITTLLPSRTSPSPVTVAQRQHLDCRQSTMKSSYDRHAGESLPPLHKGQNVRILDKASKTWIPGEVTGHSGEPRSYNVRTNQGSNIRRNRGDLREAPQQDCADTGNRPGVTTQTHPRPAPLETPSAIRPEHGPTIDHEAEPPSQSGQETVRTRSGRVIRAPARYNEYTS